MAVPLYQSVERACGADDRIVWVDDAARAEWEPRLERIRSALLTVRLAELAEGDPGAALLDCRFDRLAGLLGAVADAGLVAVPIGAYLDRVRAHNAPAPDGDPVEALVHRLVVAQPAEIETAVAALGERDAYAQRVRFGHPPCCARAAAGWPAERTDPVLAWTSAAPAPEPLAADGPPAANILARPIGLAAVTHDPCRPDCPATARLGARRLALGRTLGFAAEMDWLAEILAWPTKYSAVHGIAEVALPVLKFVVATDHTAATVRVEAAGSRWPATGKRGTVFAAPVAPPVGPARAGDRPAPPPEPAGGDAPILDFARSGLLAGVVWEHLDTVRKAKGAVLDLGCGDGLLLEMVLLENRRLTPWGVDPDAAAIAAARRRHAAADRFRAAPLGAEAVRAVVERSGPPGLVFLDAGRLARTAPADRAALANLLGGLDAPLIAHVGDEAAAAAAGGLAALLAAAGLKPVASPAAADVSAQVRPTS